MVEDDDQLRDLTGRILNRLGYRAEAVARADAALARLAHGPPVELLLTDVVLPGGTSGFELANQVRALAPGLPIVFVSGYPTKAGSIGEQYEVLRKPYTTEQLAEAVRLGFGGQ